MLDLLMYQTKADNEEEMMKTISLMTQKLTELMVTAQKNNNVDLMKTTYLLTEALFSFSNEKAHLLIIDSCFGQLFELIDTFLVAMNGEIMALNAVVAKDQLQLTVDNSYVT
jgi:hypothetical protein